MYFNLFFSPLRDCDFPVDYVCVIMAGRPTSIAAILQEGLPKKPPVSGIPTRNRFSVLKDRSVSATSGRSDYRSESQKRIRVESP